MYESLDFYYFTSSNVGACFPPFETRVCVTVEFLKGYLGCSYGLISEEELSHKHCTIFHFSDLWDEEGYICGAGFLY